MAYGNIYQFSFDSVNGAAIDIFISKKDYAGESQKRALGRAPILKREKSGCIHGTSLEIYAECLVDGEFSQLYTSSANEYKVDVYKNNTLIWTGFVSPELYSEPDIAPPYDVQIIATDGLGELKNYPTPVFDGGTSMYSYFTSMLEHTGLSLDVFACSSLRYTDDNGDSGAYAIFSILSDFANLEGESSYDSLKAILTSFNASITQLNGKWLIFRETDLAYYVDDQANLFTFDNAEEYYSFKGADYGSINTCQWWPVGNLSHVIEPAKKQVDVVFENSYKDTVLENSWMSSAEGWTLGGDASYSEEDGAFVLTSADSSIMQKVEFGEYVGYKLVLNIRARNVGTGDSDSQSLGIEVIIDGRTYAVGDVFYLKEFTSGQYTFASTEGSITKELPTPAVSDTAADASDISVVLPLYRYGSRAFTYASSVQVRMFNPAGTYPIHVYACTLSKYERSAGHKTIVTIANGARNIGDETKSILQDGSLLPSASEIFMNGIIIGNGDITEWRTHAITAENYLSLLCRDYASMYALPRMRATGILNVPADANYIPVLFRRDSTYYFPRTFSYDLRNDEINIDLLSLPNAELVVESEETTELSSSSSSGFSGGSSGGGTSGGGGGGSVTVDPFLSDTSTNPVESQAIKAYVDTADETLGDRITTLESGCQMTVFDFDINPYTMNLVMTFSVVGGGTLGFDFEIDESGNLVAIV